MISQSFKGIENTIFDEYMRPSTPAQAAAGSVTVCVHPDLGLIHISRFDFIPCAFKS